MRWAQWIYILTLLSSWLVVPSHAIATAILKERPSNQPINIDPKFRPFVYTKFLSNQKPAAGRVLILGLPGRATDSEYFARFLLKGLTQGRLSHDVVVASFNDPLTLGPVRQGTATKSKANRWILTSKTLQFIFNSAHSLIKTYDCTHVVIVGYSSGGYAAPKVAVYLAKKLHHQPVQMMGAVIIAAGSRIEPSDIKKFGLKVMLFSPPQYHGNSKGWVLLSDSKSRKLAHQTYIRLKQAGASVEIRDILSAARHRNWHWGIASPCLFWISRRDQRPDGSWPSYEEPNQELFYYIVPFIQGQPVPPPLKSPMEQECAINPAYSLPYFYSQRFLEVDPVHCLHNNYKDLHHF